MKNLKASFLSIIAVLTFVSFAEAQKNPTEGAEIRLENYNPQVSAGDVYTAELKIARSKYYQKKQTAITLKANAPKGIEVLIDPSSITGDVAKMQIKVDKTVAPGKYSISLQNGGGLTQKVVGTVFSISVNTQVLTDKQ